MSKISCAEPPPQSEDASAEGRRAPRSNLLLAASIEAGPLKAPVRIRNLSESGAALEGAALPAVGASLVLKRMSIEIGATVMWAAGTRCGVRFDGTTDVAEWIAGARAAHGLKSGQERVDVIQAAVRAGTDPMPTTLAPPPVLPPPNLDDRLAEELHFVRRLLDNLGEELIEEPVVVQRHARVLQSFDLASQILGHVATILAADDRANALNAIGMADLRARLIRKNL